MSKMAVPEIMPLPDSLPWMEGVDAKMVRAKEHLDTPHAEAGVFFESTKRNFILKSNGQEGGSSTTSTVLSRGPRSITFFAAPYRPRIHTHRAKDTGIPVSFELPLQIFCWVSGPAYSVISDGTLLHPPESCTNAFATFCPSVFSGNELTAAAALLFLLFRVLIFQNAAIKRHCGAPVFELSLGLGSGRRSLSTRRILRWAQRDKFLLPRLHSHRTTRTLFSFTVTINF
jgi:hypothetical protein